jgi:CheY-like chemotaxis protein
MIDIILIENQEFSDFVKTKLELTNIVNIDLDRKIDIVAKKIHDKYKSINLLFIINANVIIGSETFDKKKRSDCAGIELLKFIRLYGMNQHIILYSFLSREQLMTLSPHHSIIFSKGVSFIRLPEELKALDIEKLSEIKADDDLSDYFRAECHLPDNRHFMANWWGMLQLWKVHLRLRRIPLEKHQEEMNKVINEKNTIYQKEIQSLQGLIIQYLYNIKKNDVNVETYNLHGSEYLEIIEKLNLLRPLKILYVDDQAENGWSFIFQEMLYSQPKNKVNFFTLSPEIYENFDEENITQTIISNIQQENINLLILDLRLNPQIDNKQIDREKISGIKILKKLKESFIACPILITTASNKAISFKQVLTYGAHALWTKEGIDQQYMEQQSVENYVNFLKYVCNLCSSDFVLYRKSIKAINKIKNCNQQFWWETEFWSNPSYNTEYKPNNKIVKELLDKQTILELLKNAINFYSRFLTIKMLVENEKEVELLINDMWESIAIQLFKVIECVFYLDKSKNKNLDDDTKEYFSINKEVKYLLGGEFYGSNYTNLFEIRNDIAHENNDIDYKKYKEYFDRIFKFLQGYLFIDNGKKANERKNNKKIEEKTDNNQIKIQPSSNEMSYKLDVIKKGVFYTGEIGAKVQKNEDLYWVKNLRVNDKKINYCCFLRLSENPDIKYEKEELKKKKIRFKTKKVEDKFYAIEISFIEDT